ncbi:hypothetical protein [Mesorhizobium sp. M0199]|uniref:hypothetical protein n=1 Tax=Mesorhizobium sp. M0199 TaxID=2956911 RepID=UPI003338FC80
MDLVLSGIALAKSQGIRLSAAEVIEAGSCFGTVHSGGLDQVLRGMLAPPASDESADGRYKDTVIAELPKAPEN